MTDDTSKPTRSRTLTRFSQMLEYSAPEPASPLQDRPAPQLARRGRARSGLQAV